MASPVPERDDDGSVDVEAAWADIVAHWDEVGAPAAHAPDRGVPGRGAPEQAHPRHSATDQAAHDQPGSDHDQPGADQPETDQPGADQPETDQPETDQPETDQHRAEQPDPARPAGGAPSRAGHDVEDDWDVPRSRVGGERAREAAEHDAEVDAQLDERYEPPEPPPLPRGDVVSRFAWAGVLGAPLFFLIAALFWHSAPTWLVIGAVAAFVAGFVTLVVRMPDRQDDDDDGAVV